MSRPSKQALLSGVSAISLNTELPPPPVPADCDLRSEPIPRDFFVDLAVETFGVDRALAEQEFDRVIARMACEAGSA